MFLLIEYRDANIFDIFFRDILPLLTFIDVHGAKIIV